MFSGRPEEVRKARNLARTLLAGTGYEDDAALVVTELADNALLHTRSGAEGGVFGVEVSAGRSGVRIAVADQGAESELEWENSGPLAECGRGLFIVGQIAASHGMHGSADRGHTVWAVLQAPEPEGRG
ncbi:ATP-binding protein [Actinocorallia sp. A-T 12471]|uniref:ATP-binding protein n=1 Tax=Actinocorallia sp. A-T 12471 TaxID=3089813 RepID=UPI0029D3ACEA|nr:ATP-binding protein [Actinocorallia sp. A-T 12471]MDX6738691.1 ATP-binding protein [Actinocorallia sp. A-T 12471]